MSFLQSCPKATTSFHARLTSSEARRPRASRYWRICSERPPERNIHNTSTINFSFSKIICTLILYTNSHLTRSMLISMMTVNILESGENEHEQEANSSNSHWADWRQSPSWASDAESRRRNPTADDSFWWASAAQRPPGRSPSMMWTSEMNYKIWKQLEIHKTTNRSDD